MSWWTAQSARCRSARGARRRPRENLAYELGNLVWSQKRRAEYWRRTDENQWAMRELDGEAELRLEDIDAAIPLAAIYDGTAV